MKRVAVVDYGMGNVFSVQNALRRVGLRPGLAREPSDLNGVDGIVIPGVGAMPDAMDALRGQGLIDSLQKHAAQGTAILGICLGFQLLMERGTEFGEHQGLGLIPGEVVSLPFQRGSNGRPLPVPNVQWSAIDVVNGRAPVANPFDVLTTGSHLYFVHSFHVKAADDRMVVAWSRYGTFEFCAAANVGRIFGCQFHPERSGETGIRIMERFAEILGPL
jgi:imidazole glycerol-phosphate synthase subunit HisH